MKPAHVTPLETPSGTLALVAWVLGAQPAVVATVADRAAELDESAEILLAHRSPVARRVGGIIKHCLAKGGDLNQALGVKVKRGGAHDVPATRRRLRERDDELRALAAALPGKPTARANALIEKLQARDPQLLVLHQDFGMPTSTRQLVRIIRAPARD
jgi:hypothetical protein